MLEDHNLYMETHRVLDEMTQTNPLSEQYGVLLGRYRALCTIRVSLEKGFAEAKKIEADIEHRNKEFEAKKNKDLADAEFRDRDFDWKVQRDTDEFNAKIDMENQKAIFEQQRIDMENQRFAFEQQRINLEHEKIDVDKERNGIERNKILNERIKFANDDAATFLKTAGEVLQTSMRVSAHLMTYAMGAKVMLAFGKGILSDEQSGNLVYSKLIGMIPKPNMFNFKLL